MHKIHIITSFAFHNDTIDIVRDETDGSGWVSVKTLALTLGLDHKSQLKKVQDDPRFNCRLMTTVGVSGDGKTREMLMMSVEDVHFFLSTINSRKLAPRDGESTHDFNIRVEKLIAYQRECGQAIRDYWFNGAAINDRAPEDLLAVEASFRVARTSSRDSLIHAIREFAAYAMSKGVHYDKDDLFHGCLNVISGHVIGRKLLHEDEMLSGAEQRIASLYEKLIANSLINYSSWDKDCKDILTKINIHVEAFANEHPHPLIDVDILREDLVFSWDKTDTIGLSLGASLEV